MYMLMYSSSASPVPLLVDAWCLLGIHEKLTLPLDRGGARDLLLLLYTVIFLYWLQCSPTPLLLILPKCE